MPCKEGEAVGEDIGPIEGDFFEINGDAFDVKLGLDVGVEEPSIFGTARLTSTYIYYIHIITRKSSLKI